MEIPSISKLADMVMDLARKDHLPTREAIYSVANEYEVDPQQIGKELSRRSKFKRENKKKKDEKERADEIARLHNERVTHDARSHEWEMMRGFVEAGHMSDYH
jgi:dTDP-4-dehydrorhamnose reductase